MVKKKMKLLIKMIDLLNHFSMKKLFLTNFSGSIGSTEWGQIKRCMQIFN